MSNQLLLFVAFLICVSCTAQNYVMLSGRVLNQQDKSIMADVNISLEGSKSEGLTNADGFFQINVSSNGDFILKISYSDFVTKKIPIELEGWKLLRYTNNNLEISSTIDLSGFTIDGESTFIISPNGVEFETIYGFASDMVVGVNSPADSNGDDSLQLIDPFDNVIDVFGVVGEDGSSTNHEFEDGRAVRKVKVKEANPVYTFDEWRIFNDTSDSGTTLEPKNAPEDFTPGIRN